MGTMEGTQSQDKAVEIFIEESRKQIQTQTMDTMGGNCVGDMGCSHPSILDARQRATINLG